MTSPKVSALSIIESAYDRNPSCGQLAIGFNERHEEIFIGAWSEGMNRFRSVAAVGIDGQWYEMPTEIRANGVLVTAASWEPVPVQVAA